MPSAQMIRNQNPLPLPKGIQSKYIEPAASELGFHVLEAGIRGNPLILLLHGFPEIAFSWRKVMAPLADAGYYVLAPDMRGCGRTYGWDDRAYARTDLSTFTATNLVRDVLVIVQELGYSEVHCIVGHDYGARTASLAGLARPDMFRRVVILAYPYGGPPKVPKGEGKLLDEPTVPGRSDTEPSEPVLKTLAELDPPRKPYKWYYASEGAAKEMYNDGHQLKSFLRGYFYFKSASWPGNKIHPLQAWSAEELAKMPFYYTMPLDSGMRGAVEQELERSDCTPRSSESWLSNDDLQVYVREFLRTGFQGALNWYRVATSTRLQRDLALLADKRMEPPLASIVGEADWGAYQIPGAMERMPGSCDRFRGTHWIPGAGHFPHQEQPEAVIRIILDLCREAAS